jgi:hypothetical protein
MTSKASNRLLAAALAAAGALCLSTAKAEDAVRPAVYALLLDDNPFNSLVSKRGRNVAAPGASEVERYVTTDGARYFLFESTATSARIKFLCAPADPRVDCALPGSPEEILTLAANRGPRGDLFYKSADGETVLRIAAHGGAIVSWPGAAETVGAVRTQAEAGDTLRLAADTSSGAQRRADAASAALMAELGRPISFDIGWRAARSLARPAAFAAAEAAAPLAQVSEGEASVLADAVARAAAGIERVARDRAGAKAVSERIASVRFVEAARPALALDGRTLIVSYNPGGGLAGRPSSSEVARFLEGVL